MYRPDEYEHPSRELVYVVSNVSGPGSQPEDFESEFSVGCACDRRCTIDCTCTRGMTNYVEDRLAIDASTTRVIVECNSNCACDENCPNRLVQRGPLDCLVLRESPGKGLGLYSTKPIARGQFVCEYAGEVIGIDEAKLRFEENRRLGRMNYVLVVNEHIGDKRITTCVDPGSLGNIGRYANHSCQANAMLVPVRVDITVPRLGLFATRNIEPTEEISFNYAGDVAEESVQSLSETPCSCGAPACLGYLPHCPM